MNSIRSITVSCPSRLHFGLFSVGNQTEYQFGGVGLMVQSPRTEMSLFPSTRLEIEGAEVGAMHLAIERWFDWLNCRLRTEFGSQYKCTLELPIRLVLKNSPPRHQGLGTGTQIAFATALAMTYGLGLPHSSVEDFAAALDRGKRSAIGSYGFFQGGLLVERGKRLNEGISTLDFRTEFPTEWPILILLDRQAERLGRWGADEVDAFAHLPATTEVQRQEMVDIARNKIVSGVMQRDYRLFADGVREFGHRSGMYFESVQKGVFQSQQVAELVDLIHDAGKSAVGQSSWGPGIFAILQNESESAEVVDLVLSRFGSRYEIISTVADNEGVKSTGDHSVHS